MFDQAWIAIGDHKMTLAGLDVDSGRQPRRVLPGCVDNVIGGERPSIVEENASFPDSCNTMLEMKSCAESARLLQQERGGARRVENGIAAHQQTSRERPPQIWFCLSQCLSIENFRLHAAFAVVREFAPHFRHFLVIGS